MPKCVKYPISAVLISFLLGLCLAPAVAHAEWSSIVDEARAKKRAEVKKNLVFRPLLGSKCAVAELKMDLPDTYQIIYHYHMSFTEAVNLSSADLETCGLPPRPDPKSVTVGYVHLYNSWLQTMRVAMYPKNGDSIYDTDSLIVEPLPRDRYGRIPDRLGHRQSFDRDATAATCGHNELAWPYTDVWDNSQAGRDLIAEPLNGFIAPAPPPMRYQPSRCRAIRSRSRCRMSMSLSERSGLASADFIQDSAKRWRRRA